MTALTLMSYPFEGRPVYLALAPLTHAAGALCFPILALGGEIVVLPKPDLGAFLAAIAQHRVTHTFLPPTVIYLLLDHDGPATRPTSRRCSACGTAPRRCRPRGCEEAITRIGPVLGQLYGQTEAPMMISTLAPAEHLHPDGTLARERFASAGRPTPLVEVAITADDGTPPPRRRARRDRGPRLPGDARLLPQPRGDARGHPRRLAPHRRHRLPGRRRLPPHRRPRQGHDHQRRVQRVLRRGRARPPRAPRRARLRRRRSARRQVGRARHGRRSSCTPAGRSPSPRSSPSSRSASAA